MGKVKEIVTLIQEEYDIDFDLASHMADYAIGDVDELSSEAVEALEDYYVLSMDIMEESFFMIGKLFQVAKLQ